uniref:Uncharacterized protein n=1 Tax=Anas platyrhynchos platyrhynchos TaxID=8840 RepID=U3J8G6_ANAPP
MIFKLTPLDLVHWLMVLKISFPVILLDEALNVPISPNFIVPMSPPHLHVPVSPNFIVPTSQCPHISMTPYPHISLSPYPIVPMSPPISP